MADNTLYLYTSLTAGSSHIVTATARLETILKANKLPFQAIDVATDDAARKLWGRRSRGRKLPGLVKSGMIVGDLEEIEEWNEYGELRMQVNNVQSLDSFPDPTTTTSSATGTPTAEGGSGGSGAQSTTAPKQSTIKIQSPPSKEETKDSSVSLAMRQASEEAASKAKENKTNALNKPTAAAATTAATTTSATSAASTTSGAGPTEKKESEKEKPESESATTTESTTDTNSTDKKEGDSVRRKSIIGEIAGEVRRPKLVPEDAAVSSANLHADNPAALREHHRTSIVSATSKEERDQVAQDLRKSISSGNDEMLDTLRNGQGHATGTKNDNQEEVRTIEAIPQDPFEE